ncbi:hypothetical protein GCM10025331_17900 [Actinoplanes utahensis]|nr:hypothetical protein Aut01nite_25100 [Actinoplanes utahensis]
MPAAVMGVAVTIAFGPVAALRPEPAATSRGSHGTIGSGGGRSLTRTAKGPKKEADRE